MKKCKDCKYVIPYKFLFIRDYKYDRCKHPKLVKPEKINFHLGETKAKINEDSLFFCITMRRTPLYESTKSLICGPEARYFEEK